tara:strand:+ start:332 stop:481 length:150 start_codon:yes stop_codon:yes gene_type:complete
MGVEPDFMVLQGLKVFKEQEEDKDLTDGQVEPEVKEHKVVQDLEVLKVI